MSKTAILATSVVYLLAFCDLADSITCSQGTKKKKNPG